MNTRKLATVSGPDTNVATQMLLASRRGDWDGVRDCLDPEVVWTLPGTSQVSGEVIGIDDVVRIAQIIDSANLTVEPKHVLVGFDTVIATIHNTASKPVALDEQLALVFEIRNRKITSIATHLSDVPGLDRFYAAQTLTSK